jgi:hypothetical protein
MRHPKAVYIQTRTDCNNTCSICPQPKAFEKFGLQIMSEDLFVSILQELFHEDYTGIIGLFLQQEPLLDDRIFDFIRMAKSGKASVEISTNGILLKEQADQLKESDVDRVYFNYGSVKYGTAQNDVIDDVVGLIDDLNVIVNYPLLGMESASHLFPGCLVQSFWASNRGGNVDVSHTHKTKFAARNCQQLNIVANGDVILCCNDYMRDNIFGNAAMVNPLDIWRFIPKHFDYQICLDCI